MTSDRGAKPLREGSAAKRASILAAARELFLADGFPRTSVDAIAARAGVSKRTVYDYYGDKRAVLMAVLDDAGHALMTSIQAALDTYLTDVVDLEAALVAFARQVATDTFASSDYAVLRRLFTTETTHLPELSEHWLANAPEEAMARRFAALAQTGQLEAPDPRLAAEHFVALTFLLALDTTGPGPNAGATQIDTAITTGVPVFLRAYGSRPGSADAAVAP